MINNRIDFMLGELSAYGINIDGLDDDRAIEQSYFQMLRDKAGAGNYEGQKTLFIESIRDFNRLSTNSPAEFKETVYCIWRLFTKSYGWEPDFAWEVKQAAERHFNITL